MASVSDFFFTRLRNVVFFLCVSSFYGIKETLFSFKRYSNILCLLVTRRVSVLHQVVLKIRSSINLKFSKICLFIYISTQTPMPSLKPVFQPKKKISIHTIHTKVGET